MFKDSQNYAAVGMCVGAIAGTILTGGMWGGIAGTIVGLSVGLGIMNRVDAEEKRVRNIEKELARLRTNEEGE
jgi:flagellar biosynthesis protein FliR